IPAPFARAAERVRRLPCRLLVVTAAVLLLPAVWVYDALGYQQALRFERDQTDDCPAVLGNWRHYQTWHPTWELSLPAAARERLASARGRVEERSSRQAYE